MYDGSLTNKSKILVYQVFTICDFRLLLFLYFDVCCIIKVTLSVDIFLRVILTPLGTSQVVQNRLYF